MPTLILAYDAAHTPLDRVADALPDGECAVILAIDLGGETPPPVCPSRIEVVRVDATHQFADDYVARAIKCNAVYDGGYYLSAALSRPLIAELAARHAARLGADTIVHGFSGNDALRVTAGLRTLAPALRIRSVRDVCGDAGDPADGGYTVSSNLWGHSVEGGGLSDPWRPAPPVLGALAYPDGPQRVEVEFEEGRPVVVDGVRMPLADLIGALSTIGARFSAGRSDVVENGQIGLKTRALYDAPAAAALVAAHRDLERLVCSRREQRFKSLADAEWTELVYDGLWFDPARRTIERSIDAVNARVTGRVLLEFSPGAVRVVARESRFSLHDETCAVYRAGYSFGQPLIECLAEQQSLAARLSRTTAGNEDRCFA